MYHQSKRPRQIKVVKWRENSAPMNNNIIIGLFMIYRIPPLDYCSVVVSCSVRHKSGDVVDNWLKRLIQEI